MMSQEAAAQAPQQLWFSHAKSFFSLPNPKIFRVFVSSGVATFILGTAMTVEWILYSRLQEGFHWITYYAPFLIAFPVIIWTVMALSAIVHVNKHRNLDISPLADSITESDMLEIDLEDSITESDMLEIDLEQDPTVRDHPLALMKVELIVDDSDDDHLSDLIKELPSWIHSIGDNKMLKRTSSWPPLVTTSSCGKSNRTVSF